MPRSSAARPSSAAGAALSASSRQTILTVKLAHPFCPVLGLLQLGRLDSRDHGERFVGFARAPKLAVGPGQEVMRRAVIIRGDRFLQFRFSQFIPSDAVIGFAKAPPRLCEA